jgi:hypothetical protein
VEDISNHIMGALHANQEQHRNTQHVERPARGSDRTVIQDCVRRTERGMAVGSDASLGKAEGHDAVIRNLAFEFVLGGQNL